MRINIISAYFSRRRMKKALLKWNENVEYITHCIEESSDPNAGFKWTQLVWQEIIMWIRLREQVSQEDFDWIISRRGFDQKMVSYLKSTLTHVGLSKLLV